MDVRKYKALRVARCGLYNISITDTYQNGGGKKSRIIPREGSWGEAGDEAQAYLEGRGIKVHGFFTTDPGEVLHLLVDIGEQL